MRSAAERIDRGVELRQHCVAGVMQHLAVMTLDRFGNQVEVISQRTMGRVLMTAHKPAVASRIRVQNGGESSWKSVRVRGSR